MLSLSGVCCLHGGLGGWSLHRLELIVDSGPLARYGRNDHLPKQDNETMTPASIEIIFIIIWGISLLGPVLKPGFCK